MFASLKVEDNTCMILGKSEGKASQCRLKQVGLLSTLACIRGCSFWPIDRCESAGVR